MSPWHPTDNSVTAVDFFGVVRRWDIAAAPSSPRHLVEVVDGVGLINSVAFAPDGSGFAVATSTGLVETIDDAGVLVRSFEQPRGNVDSVAFSPDSTTVASAMGERRGPESFDDTVTIFDASQAGRPAQFGGEAEQVVGCAFFRNEVRFSPDGELMAANSHDFTVSLYDASDGTILHTFAAHGSTVTDFAFSPKGDLLATTSDDSTLRVWSVADHQLVKEYTTPAGGYWSLVFGGDGRRSWSATSSGTVSVLDLDTGTVAAHVRRPEKPSGRTGDLPGRFARGVGGRGQLGRAVVGLDRRDRRPTARSHRAGADRGVLLRRHQARVGIERRHRASVGAGILNRD